MSMQSIGVSFELLYIYFEVDNVIEWVLGEFGGRCGGLYAVDGTGLP